MTEQFTTALNLMVIGMVTVFVVLLLVVWGGKLLIFFTNKFWTPVVEVNKEKLPVNNDIHIAVLTSVVEHVTGGRGKIKQLEKLK